jgi:hypothetical protein
VEATAADPVSFWPPKNLRVECSKAGSGSYHSGSSNNAEIVEAALDANSHVLSEKPHCLRLAQFEFMAVRAKTQNCLLMMGFASRGLSFPSPVNAK